MKPIIRKELYLNKIVGNNDYETPEKPISEEEFFFAEILGEAVQAPEPLTRYQMYLAKIAGREIEIPYPEVRLEYFLAKAAGMEIEAPTPITKEEIFWSNYSAIIDFELEGIPPLTYKAVASALKDYIICGNTIEGESVGDKTDNIIRDYAVGRTQARNAVALFIDAELIPNTTYSFACLLNSSELRLYINENLFNTIRYVKDDVVLKVIVKTLSELPDSQKIDGKWIMLKNSITEPVVPELSNIMMIKGSEMPAIYEPYGYRVPVTVSNGTDSQTSPIYLPEPIKMVGNEAEYIDYAEQKQHRVRKNLLPNAATSQTINGVTFTVNSDGSVTCNGTATTIAFFSWISAGILPNNKRVLLTGCPSGGGTSNYLLKMQIVGSPDALITDTGRGSITLFSQPIYPVLRIQAGYTCNNLTFYPMLRLASITDDTYEPYIENTDLNVTLPALPVLPGTNTLTVGTEVQPSNVYIKYEGERQ